MTLPELLRALAVDGGSGLLALDEARALHGAERTAKQCAAAEARANLLAAAASAKGAGATAVVGLYGPLYSRGTWGMEGFRGRLADAVNNPDVAAIVLDVDSPGGTVAGTAETAKAVRDAAAAKPVTAVVDSLAASAAYWIASQAGAVVATPGSDLGSIGVLAIHMDLSALLEASGVKATVVRSTPFKAEGNPFEPLSEDARAHLQGEVDGAHADFIRAVAEGRRVSMSKVSSDFGQGRVMNAQAAVRVGLADRIGTLAEVLGAAGGRAMRPRRRSALAFA